MKNRLFITLIAALLPVLIFAQKEILGTWLTEEKDGKVIVYEKNNKFFGKIIWLKDDQESDSKKLDVKNPDESLRARPVKGVIILKDLIWDEDDQEWDDGEIYDPKTGNTYSLFARLEDPNTLYLKGYIGFSLIGRSTLWTRVNGS